MEQNTIINKGIYYFGNREDYQGYKITLSNSSHYFEDLNGNKITEDELYSRERPIALSKYDGRFDNLTLENII